MINVSWNLSSYRDTEYIYSAQTSSRSFSRYNCSYTTTISIYTCYTSGGISGFNHNYFPYVCWGTSTSSYPNSYPFYSSSSPSSHFTYNNSSAKTPNLILNLYTTFRYCYKITLIDEQFSPNNPTECYAPAQCSFYLTAPNLTANNFGKNNYVFSHWEADIDGVTKTFYDQEQILNLTTTNDNTYTFLAQWRSVSTPVGSGTQDNPFIINSIETLEFIRMQIETYVNTDNYFYKQTANIDLSDVIWIPIGKESNKFRGKYNGNGMVIENLDSLPLSKNISNVGLCGWTDSALIEKLQVINSSFSGDDNVGAIVANASVSTIIRNCILENCNIEAKQNNGAVIGNNYGTIENILVITSNCSSGNLGGQLRSSCLYQLGDIQYKTSDNINDYATWGKISNDGQAVQIELFWQAQFFEFTQNDLNSYILKN